MNQNSGDNWRQTIAPYEKSNIKRSIWQITNTFIPFMLLWGATYWSLSMSYLLTLLLAGITAGLIVRIFIIFHDCCHGSFFNSRKANRILGTIAGILTFCPFDQWRYTHARHHATNGNLDKRGVGDIWTLTVEEYLELPSWKRIAYRLYRNPIVLFGLGPSFTFLIEYRFNRKGAKRKERLNTYLVNISIVSIVALFCWLIGWKAFLLVEGPIFLISSLIGVWLFYVQHQFEGTYFEKEENWNHFDAAIQGSSFYNLPKVLHWFTGNIGFHHIHHLSSRIPNYYLNHIHKENSIFRNVASINLLTSLKSLRYRIWDENRKELMGFGYVRDFVRAKRKTG